VILGKVYFETFNSQKILRFDPDVERGQRSLVAREVLLQQSTSVIVFHLGRCEIS